MVSCCCWGVGLYVCFVLSVARRRIVLVDVVVYRVFLMSVVRYRRVFCVLGVLRWLEGF